VRFRIDNARLGHKRSARSRGFSAVELLIVIGFTSVGFVALLQLQVATIQGLGYPARLNLAAAYGEHFLATLQVEATEWTDQGEQTLSNANLRYLTQFNEGAPQQWILANPPQGPDFALTDYVGNNVFYDSGILREVPATATPRFCLHYRLAWATANPNMLRADVRVSWLREEAAWEDFKDCPAGMLDPVQRGNVHSIRLSELIMRNSGS
jgi:hypothetical protein